MNIEKWINNNCKSLKNKVVAVSGATGGIGKILCFYLAKLEAHIVLLCRDKQKAEKLAFNIKQQYKNATIDYIELDFFNIKNVNNCINKLKLYKGIDILINNAGIYNVPIKTLESRYNNIFQVNFLYQYYFTKQLLSELQKSSNPVCITVSSIAHTFAKLDINDIDYSARKKQSKIYGNSKRFLTGAMQELFKDSNIKLAIVHPGITLTNMTNHYPKAINWLVKIAIKLFFPSPKKATLNILYGLNHYTTYGEWIGPSIFNIWGKPKKKKLKSITQLESKQMFDIAENIIKSIKNN